MSISYSKAENQFIISSEVAGFAGARRNHEVLRFVNLLNSQSALGHFYLCRKCDSPHFRYIQNIAVADLSDQIIEESMDIACFRLLYNVDPIHSIVTRGKTAEEALQELPLSTDPDADPDGGVE